MSEPKEYWIKEDDHGELHVSEFEWDGYTRVIEKSAYDTVVAELERWKQMQANICDERDALKLELAAANGDIENAHNRGVAKGVDTIRPEIDRLKAELKQVSSSFLAEFASAGTTVETVANGDIENAQILNDLKAENERLKENYADHMVVYEEMLDAQVEVAKLEEALLIVEEWAVAGHIHFAQELFKNIDDILGTDKFLGK